MNGRCIGKKYFSKGKSQPILLQDGIMPVLCIHKIMIAIVDLILS